MKTTTSSLTLTALRLFFPFVLAVFGAGCAAAADGPDSENGAPVGGEMGGPEEPPPSTADRALVRTADGDGRDVAVSHVADEPAAGGTPHEGPTTIGKPHHQE